MGSVRKLLQARDVSGRGGSVPEPLAMGVLRSPSVAKRFHRM